MSPLWSDPLAASSARFIPKSDAKGSFKNASLSKTDAFLNDPFASTTPLRPEFLKERFEIVA